MPKKTSSISPPGGEKPARWRYWGNVPLMRRPKSDDTHLYDDKVYERAKNVSEDQLRSLVRRTVQRRAAVQSMHRRLREDQERGHPVKTRAEMRMQGQSYQFLHEQAGARPLSQEERDLLELGVPGHLVRSKQAVRTDRGGDGGGEVHVDAHTRDGYEVRAYDRSKPSK